MTMLNSPQGGMHPDDKRNLLIFFALCLGAFLLYDVFVHQPKMKALEEAQRVRAEAIASGELVEETPAVPLSREDALDTNVARIKIENPDLSGSLSARGGRIDDLALKQYFKTVDKKDPVTLLSPARTEHPLFIDFGWLASGGADIRLPSADTNWRASATTLSKDSPVTLRWSNGAGLTFTREYSLDEHYMFTVKQSVTNTGRAPVALHPYASLTRQGLPEDFKPIAVLHEGPIGYFDGSLEEVKYKDLNKKPKQEFPAQTGWAGFSDKYWFTGLVPAKGEGQTFRIKKSGNDEKPVYQINATGDALIW